MLSDFYTKGDAEEAWAKFPAEIGDLFRVLWLELVRLNARYKLYAELYGERDSVNILDDAAPHAFGLIQASLQSDIVLTLSRLLDPSSMGKNRNITFSRLIEECGKHDLELAENAPADAFCRDGDRPAYGARNHGCLSALRTAIQQPTRRRT
jgi:hypothetical protein